MSTISKTTPKVETQKEKKFFEVTTERHMLTVYKVEATTADDASETVWELIGESSIYDIREGTTDSECKVRVTATNYLEEDGSDLEEVIEVKEYEKD